MKSRNAAAGVAMAAVLAATGAWSGTSGASAGPGQPGIWQGQEWQDPAVGSVAEAKRLVGNGITLILVNRSIHFAKVDLGDAGESPGDVYLFEHRSFNEAETEVIGKSTSFCELGITARVNCEGTQRLNGRGKITISGTVFGPRDNVYAVTGGTGEFSGARGEMHSFFLRNGGCCGVFLRIYKLE